ncbi:GNAT family N-acetyltransferase [Rhodocista pekingensis]|uniref:GNAT family N-acetyltransferase n=1 Tax=Rhodocista pekingensis TaxID=201185 RepID=A0ABW2L152_9PROT
MPPIPHEARAAAAAPRLAGPADRAALARLLAAAFATDPVMDWWVRDGAARAQALHGFYDAELAEVLPLGASFMAEDASACAVWLPPDAAVRHYPFWRKLMMVPRYLRFCGVARARRLIALGDMMERNHPPAPPHWYLYFLAVDPALKGRGLGSAILAATLARVDADGLPAYLENSSPANLRLYERHGFRLVKQDRPLPGAPCQWTMWRGPAPKESTPVGSFGAA